MRKERLGLRKTSMTADEFVPCGIRQMAHKAVSAGRDGGCRARRIPLSVSALNMLLADAAARGRRPVRRRLYRHADRGHAPWCRWRRSAVVSMSPSPLPSCCQRAQVRFKACCRIESWSGLSPTSLTRRVSSTGLICAAADSHRAGDGRAALFAGHARHQVLARD